MPSSISAKCVAGNLHTYNYRKQIRKMLINLAQVELGERIREEFNEEKMFELSEDIRLRGQWVPIIVEDIGDGTYSLIEGERRCKVMAKLHAQDIDIPSWVVTTTAEDGTVAPTILPHGMVHAEVKGKLPPELKMIMEFELNSKRADFTWQEKAKFIRKIHNVYKEKFPEYWNRDATGALLGVSPSTVQNCVTLDKAIEDHPEIAKAETLRAAIKRKQTATKLDDRYDRVVKDESAHVATANEMVTCADAKDWIIGIDKESVDLVIFDPPWGDNTSWKPAENWGSFDDSKENADDLMYYLLPRLFRVLREDRWMVFFYRQHCYEEMIELLSSHGFNLKGTATPCIWFKPDKTTDQNRFPEHTLINAYENFLLVKKGSPVFYNKGEQLTNIFEFPRAPRRDLSHPTEKPLELATTLISMLTVPGETVLDPTAGSGVFLDAAYRGHRKARGCELDKEFHKRIITRISEAM